LLKLMVQLICSTKIFFTCLKIITYFFL